MQVILPLAEDTSDLDLATDVAEEHDVGRHWKAAYARPDLITCTTELAARVSKKVERAVE